MSEFGKFEKGTPVDPNESSRRVERETLIPNTPDQPVPGGLVGRQAIEATSLLGHDNLEAESEHEKEIRSQDFPNQLD
jgi:hypothetical protein